MAEWSKAAVLKTAEAYASVGSNPTPSAIPSPTIPLRCYWAMLRLPLISGRLPTPFSEITIR